MKVSLIIPVYNIDQYLPRCLQCIESLDFNDFETILVDDGSLDNSGLICDEFAAKHENCTVVHKNNGGVCSARNEGLKHAKGDYVCFIDGDDTFDSKLLSVLYNNALQYGADISCCSLLFIGIDGALHKSKAHQQKFVWSPEKAAKEFFTNAFAKEILYGPYNKIIKKSLARQCKFVDGLALGEDLLFVFECISKCNLLCVEDLPLYNYIKRKNSATTSGFSIKNYDYIKALEMITTTCENRFPDVAYEAKVYLYVIKTVFCWDLIKLGEKNKYVNIFNTCLCYIKKYQNEVWKKLTLKTKIMLIIVRLYNFFTK